MAQPTYTVFTDAFAGGETYLKDALSFVEARRAHAAIVAVAEEQPFSYMAGADMVVENWVKEIASLRHQVAGIADAAADLAARRGLSAEARSLTALMGNVSRRVAQHARYGDLSIIRAPAGDGAELQTEIADGLLFAGGRPVLLLPATKTELAPGGTAVIAWDGSREAARALFDALPYLKQAEEVSVALVEPRESAGGLGEEPGGDIARTLARHDVRVSVDRLPDLGKGVAEALQNHAVGLGARLLVMGGYGHSRLRQAIFGGVTRDMLLGARLPLMMSH